MKRSPLKRSAKRIPRRRDKPRKVSVDREPMYLDWLRNENRCFVCELLAVREWLRHGSYNCGSVDPAHGPVNGMGSKGPDSGAIPLGRGHHDEQHLITWAAFQGKYEFDRAREAAVYYRTYQLIGRVN